MLLEGLERLNLWPTHKVVDEPIAQTFKAMVDI